VERDQGQRSALKPQGAPAAPQAAVPVPVIPSLPAPAVEPPKPAVEGNGISDAKAADKAAVRRRSELAAQQIAPPRDGMVSFAITPWGEVVVNGTARGVSPPLTQIPLSPGVHTIEVRNGAAAPFIARVEVRAGETITLQHRF
jgi:hypothetical protein